MKLNKKKLIIIFSIAILIVPDIIINFKKDIIIFSLIIISKICLLIFFSLILQKLTKSYFISYITLGFLYLSSSLIETINTCILNNYITLDNIKALFYTSKSEINEFYNQFYLYFLIPIFIFISFLFILKKIKIYNYNKNNHIIIYSIVSLFISISISTYLVFNSPQIFSGTNIIKYTFKKYYVKQHPFNIFYRAYELIISRSKFNKYKLQKDSFKFNVLNKTDSLDRPDIVILIIGERIRYSNWSINDYKKKQAQI